MSRKIPKITGIKNDSQIKAIGNIHRHLNNAGWRINIQLEPGKDKRSLGISQIPLLARRRVINATEEPTAAGYEMSFTLDGVTWEAVKIRDCPVRGVAQSPDADQWCFQFQRGHIQIFLPQLELARALFLYEPYLCRLAMIPNGLAQEFDVQPLADPGSIQINLLKSCTLPKHFRGDHELRRALASVILDPDMRKAFESISKYQTENGKDIRGHRVFEFRFDPPPLNEVHLTVRGHYDQAKAAIFVYEIYGIEGLSCNHAHRVHFFDPDYKQATPGSGAPIKVKPTPLPPPAINDDKTPQEPKPTEWVLESPQVIRSYINPAHTTRNGIDKKRSSGTSTENEPNSDTDKGGKEANTDEPSKDGNVPCAGIDGLDDQSDDTHNYASRFQAFAAMVANMQIKGCIELNHVLRKLPAIAGRSKHLLDDGNPRLWSIYFLSLNSVSLALMEVDTFGNRSQLSTLLIRQPSTNFDWGSALPEIERRVVHEHLKWPTKYLEATFPAGTVQRIPHPQTSSGDKAFLEADSIQHWADRILVRMQ